MVTIIEDNNDFEYLQNSLKDSDSFWIPVYSDAYKHYTCNALSFIYIYSIKLDLEFILSFQHTDCINQDIERLQQVTSQGDIFVLAKKRFGKFFSGKCYDADLMAWWQTHKMLPLTDTNTAAHDIWNRWWHNETNTNDWLPITRHIERCTSMRTEFMKSYTTFEMTPEFQQYDAYAIDNFFAIEQNGLHVDTKLYTEKFQSNGIHNGKVFTEYNLYTSTGRPSNKFGGVNYAALNKEDGCRGSFVSRHEHGMLLELDYDAFHVRLIADMIGFDLPDGSIHEYFGKQYFDTDTLTEEQYGQSKQITFRLLYGGIDKDFAKIPFFGEVKSYVAKLWRSFKRDGYIKTEQFKRPMYSEHLHEMNPNKLFNYQLQAGETEHNLHTINNVNEMIQSYKSKLILYTYDSLLFDYNLDDGKQFLIDLKNTISENGKYPVKIKAGINYHGMKDVTSRTA